MKKATIRRLVWAAYNLGWRNACDDHSTQQFESAHPIGRSKAIDPRTVVRQIDPSDLMGLH